MNNNNITLLKAQKNDLSAIKSLLDSCGLPSNDLTEKHISHFYTLKKDNKIVGSVGLEIHGEHGLLRSLATKEAIRGTGYGKLLVKQIEDYAQRRDLKNIYLLTTTAEAFFKKIGYTNIDRAEIPAPIQESEEFSSICPDSASSMIKEI